LEIGDVDEIAHGFDYAPYRKVFSVDPITAELYRNVFSPESLAGHVRQRFPAFPPSTSIRCSITWRMRRARSVRLVGTIAWWS